MKKPPVELASDIVTATTHIKDITKAIRDGRSDEFVAENVLHARRIVAEKLGERIPSEQIPFTIDATKGEATKITSLSERHKPRSR